MLRLSRREYLALLVSSNAFGRKRQLGATPEISVQDFEQYPSILTPASDFFVRNHFAIPAVDASDWKLHIGGMVSRAADFSLQELHAAKPRSVSSLMECAGNGVGVGAVGCADWEGISLGELLRSCGIAGGAKYLRLTGEDRGREPDAPEVTYSRCLSIDDAMRPTTLIAFGMSGAPLEPAHGYPARVVVPGRYGMDSVKWLRSVEALAAPDDSFYMAQRFRRVRQATPGDVVGDIRVKSIIVKPLPGAALRGQNLEACGYAWAGPQAVQKVEIRLDGGAWRAAHLLSQPEPLTWVAWSFAGPLDRPGKHTIQSRATSASGETQPAERDASREDEYELNQAQTVPFFFRP